MKVELTSRLEPSVLPACRRPGNAWRWRRCSIQQAAVNGGQRYTQSVFWS